MFVRFIVFPQEPKQKEDELTSVNVKQGFINPPPFPPPYTEYLGALHTHRIDREKVYASVVYVIAYMNSNNGYNQLKYLNSYDQ